MIDLVGERFGRLTVVERGEIKNHKQQWKFKVWQYIILRMPTQGKGCRTRKSQCHSRQKPRTQNKALLNLVWYATTLQQS